VSPPRRRLARRLLLAVALLGLVAVASFSCVARQFGGKFTHAPEEWRSALSPRARALVDASLADLAGPRLDYHTHLVGLGDSGSGAWVNPAMRSWAHPVLRVKFAVYLSSCAIEDLGRADEQYLGRLVDLIRASPGPARHALLAFDRNHRADGSPDEELSNFYVPNEYVLAVARRHPDLFVPVGSVHPWRADAVAELERCAKAGIRMLKWIPSGMGIDPADPRCDPFYDRMRELGVALLTHAGREEAIDVEEAQKLGNPLRLRRALDHGVKVVVAHCASFGDDEDLDDPRKPLVSSFDLFLRMMEEKRYEGLLFGEISAVTDCLRDRRPIGVLLERTDLHPRLVDGSDYPIPAVNVLVWTGRFVRWGYLDAADEAPLDEIYGVNPLLFDYVLKRRLRHPESGARFPPSVFQANPQLELE
jgi:hypothetical protein